MLRSLVRPLALTTPSFIVLLRTSFTLLFDFTTSEELRGSCLFVGLDPIQCPRHRLQSKIKPHVRWCSVSDSKLFSQVERSHDRRNRRWCHCWCLADPFRSVYLASPTKETRWRLWKRRKHQNHEKRTPLCQLRLRNWTSHTPHPFPTTAIGIYTPRFTYGIHFTDRNPFGRKLS